MTQSDMCDSFSDLLLLRGSWTEVQLDFYTSKPDNRSREDRDA